MASPRSREGLAPSLREVATFLLAVEEGQTGFQNELCRVPREQTVGQRDMEILKLELSVRMAKDGEDIDPCRQESSRQTSARAARVQAAGVLPVLSGIPPFLWVLILWFVCLPALLLLVWLILVTMG